MRRYDLLDGGRGTEMTFRPTLSGSLDMADAVYHSICRDIDRCAEREGIEAPPGRRYTPVFWAPADEPLSHDLAGENVASIIWAIGYRPDRRWVKVGAFDGSAHPATPSTAWSRARGGLP
ncbi:hypothetical protein [Amycolatopsis sp. SID8362]|uniref:hypothetical protein n=1 Tax=Amycolatopsis sp. SID8362 TaxID=2690346 RepID=UPI001370D3D4|nr:hypothetical protein [Amycolatopsis sp. SID8362]NBH06091.1 hypothetical protein [Amycolatopsis sp. SID8362]NED42790.1 hypothetical protein [Amycolatopsis sp. SID8362]